MVHVGLYGPPQRRDVAGAKACSPHALDHLKEECVTAKQRLGELLKKVSVGEGDVDRHENKQVHRFD